MHYRMRQEDIDKFEKLAERLLSEGVDAVHYVEWAFDFYRVNRPVVYASHIASPKTLQIYRDKIPSVTREVSLEISLQIDTLKTQLALGRDAREIIDDPYLELGSLFRYALAKKARLPELAARFKDDADLTLRQHQLYRDFLSGFLGSTE
jgi:hypothetical protein